MTLETTSLVQKYSEIKTFASMVEFMNIYGMYCNELLEISRGFAQSLCLERKTSIHLEKLKDAKEKKKNKQKKTK